MVGVVFLQYVRDMNFCRQQFLVCIGVDIAAVRVGRPVCSVTAERENSCVRKILYKRRSRECELLIPAAKAFARKMYNGLAAGDERKLPAFLRMGP